MMCTYTCRLVAWFVMCAPITSVDLKPLYIHICNGGAKSWYLPAYIYNMLFMKFFFTYFVLISCRATCIARITLVNQHRGNHSLYLSILYFHVNVQHRYLYYFLNIYELACRENCWTFVTVQLLLGY